ncbi:MAG: EAL domain-containing protein [Spirochaetia bacterium]|nr:EAL domain-containing protein [Spirochaetia bacterium]
MFLDKDQLFSSLYDMALTIGSYDRLKPLLKNSLRSFLSHSGASAGIIFLIEDNLFFYNNNSRKKTIDLILSMAIGDSKIYSYVGQKISFSNNLMKEKTYKIPVSLMQKIFKINKSRYKEILKFVIPENGIFFLFFEDTQISRQVLKELFRPILSNMAKLIQLCRANEEYMNKLISKKKIAETELFHERERAEVTLKSIADAVVATDVHENITYMNPVAENLCRYSFEKIKGKYAGDYFKIISGKKENNTFFPSKRCIQENKIIEITQNIFLEVIHNEKIPIECTVSPMRDKNGNIIGSVTAIRDVSKTRSMMRELAWLASHDSLTGLVNRKEFERRVKLSLETAKEMQIAHALLYIDLDKFKLVNDTFGHSAGDELLKKFTSYLFNAVERKHTFARLGGDEFGILLVDTNLENTIKFCEKIFKNIKKFRFKWEKNIFEISASIGIAEINKESSDVSKLLGIADMACYKAKSLGPNKYYFAEEEKKTMQKSFDEFDLITKIRIALKKNSFKLFCQKILSVSNTNGSLHYEVLLRLFDDSGKKAKLISPSEFIPVAEKYGLMPEIDKWVIQNLFSSISGGKDKNTKYNHIEFSINLSGQTLNEESIINFIQNEIQTYNLNANQICFELTETVAVENLSRTRHLINELKNYGFRFSLDDFGAGISSFSYLKNLPVNYLKIDGEFIREIIDSHSNFAIVEAIYKLGKAMQIEVIAEYAENNRIVERLKKIGIDYIQGFAIAEPIPFDYILSIKN